MKRVLMLLFTLILLAGCVEYNEELWLNPDGSGRAKLRLVHRSNFDNRKEIWNKSGLPGIHLQSMETSRSGSFYIYNVAFKFDNIESFNNINDQLSAADFWGNITLTKTPDGNILFRRRISLGSQGEDAIDDLVENIYKSQQKDHPVWSYKLHVPWKIISANTTEEQINRKHKTIQWKYDTLQMWNKFEIMTVEMKKGISWLVFVLAGVVLALLAFFVFWLIKISKRSHLKDAIQHIQEHSAEQKE